MMLEFHRSQSPEARQFSESIAVELGRYVCGRKHAEFEPDSQVIKTNSDLSDWMLNAGEEQDADAMSEEEVTRRMWEVLNHVFYATSYPRHWASQASYLVGSVRLVVSLLLRMEEDYSLVSPADAARTRSVLGDVLQKRQTGDRNFEGEEWLNDIVIRGPQDYLIQYRRDAGE